MSQKTLSFLLLLLFSLFSFSLNLAICFGNESNPSPAEPLSVFVFAGQSNMVGKRCKIDQLPEEMQKENQKALFFHAKQQAWVPIAPGLTEPSGFGPEISFAAKMTELVDHPIGIIKLSRGGTNLHTQWSPADSKSLYGQLQRMVLSANKVRPIKVIGMIWVQGGADAKSEEMADAYAANLKNFATQARADFKNPNMVFLSGRIPPKSDKTKPYWKTVRLAQQDLKLAHYHWINCDDITTGKDKIHYDTPGMVKIGERQAVVMRKMLQLKK